jgi:hypothetical protein
MARVKNQHYYPQSCLRRFADDSGRLYCCDKATGKVFRPGVANVASEQGFYDLPPQFAADPQVVEREFTRLEGDARPLFDRLLADVEANGRFEAADPTWRRDVAAFVALQDCRTRSFRQGFEQMAAAITAALAARRGPAAPADAAFDFNISALDLPGAHAEFMLTTSYLDQAAAALAGHIWFVAQNDTDQPLYTSDAPVVRHAHDSSWAGGMGLASRGIEVVFPLTPRYALVMAERTFFPRLQHLDGESLPLSPAGVASYNGLQIMHSRRQVYCSEDKFDQVRDFATKCPDAFNPDRMQVEASTGPPGSGDPGHHPFA